MAFIKVPGKKLAIYRVQEIPFCKLTIITSNWAQGVI